MILGEFSENLGRFLEDFESNSDRKKIKKEDHVCRFMLTQNPQVLDLDHQGAHNKGEETVARTKQYIAISNCRLECDCYPIDTEEQIEVAQQAMRELDLHSSWIYVGDPDCPDSYRTNAMLLADEKSATPDDDTNRPRSDVDVFDALLAE